MTFDVRNVKDLVENSPSYFDTFTIVVGAQLDPVTSLRVEKICRERAIPLVLGKVNGLLGYIRNSVACHTVIESKPDSYVHRLHVRDPWPELIELARKVSQDVLAQTSTGDKVKCHKEVPWVLLIVNRIAMLKAKESDFNVDDLARNGAKRRAFLDEICQESVDFIEPINKMTYEQGLKDGMPEEKMNKKMMPCPALNYSEARTFGSSSLLPFSMPYSPEFQDVMSDERVTSSQTPKLPNTRDGQFWKMARALKRFIDKYNRFPVRKEVPDMEAGNKYYVMLQACYHKKSVDDLALFTNELRAEYGDDDMPSKELIARFCKNAPFLEVFRMSSLQEERNRNLEDDVDMLADEDDWLYNVGKSNMDLHPFKFYLLLRVADSFYEENGYFPGWTDDTYASDLKKIAPHAASVLKSCGLAEDYLSDDHLNEIVRYGGAEIHSVAAFVGGLVAQEAIKLITHQFQPLNNTFVYNGLNGTAEKFRM